MGLAGRVPLQTFGRFLVANVTEALVTKLGIVFKRADFDIFGECILIDGTIGATMGQNISLTTLDNDTVIVGLLVHLLRLRDRLGLLGGGGVALSKSMFR